MKTIIVKVNLILPKQESEKVEQQLRESINRQRGTGVIVLPNYVSYEGAVDEAEPGDTFCTEENCEIFARDLSCDRCTK